MKGISLTLVLILVAGVLYSQDLSSSSKKAIRYYQESEDFILRRQYTEAINLLNLAIEKDPEFAEAHFRLGYIHKNLGEFEHSRKHLEEADKHLPDKSKLPALLFHLGEMYFFVSEYYQALVRLESFVEIRPDSRNSNLAKQYIANCRFAIENMKIKMEFNPKPLSGPVNEFQLQYFPVLPVDQNSIIYTRRLGNTPDADEDIVISRRDANGNWSVPEALSENINSDFNEGTCTISADSRILIFTSCFGRRGFGSCDLFMSHRIGDDWSEPENLGGSINSKAWESQPSLSADGRTLYFVSNRRGLGNRDLWVSTVDENGDWTKARNLGSMINGAGDEISPFIHNNGQTLYFASNGRTGFGGYDLFVTELVDNKWTEPENLGYPINSSADQVSLFITADGRKGYYSYEVSDPSYGLRSLLYEFDIPEQIRLKNASNFVQGHVYDAETREVLEARIELYDLELDTLKSLVESDPVSGEYIMVLTQGAEYGLYVTKENYLFQSLSFNYLEKRDLEPIVIDIFLQPIHSGVSTVLNNIFFAFDSYELETKSITELHQVAKFMSSNPGVSIMIEGHTDDRGAVDYNLDLSLKRAKAVYDHLVSQGISAERMKFEGFGKSKPVAPNDSEENRQMNRRIEFRIL